MSFSSYDFRDAYKAVAEAIHHVGDGLFAIAGAIERSNGK